jgi:predicted site-specific integrase-resolvase
VNGQPAPMLKFRPVADALGVSESTARRLARAGVLERVQVSERGYRVTEASLRRLLAEGYAAARGEGGAR